MVSSAQSGIVVDIRDDGVYLVITKKVARKEVIDIIESYQIQDIDFAAVNEMFKQDGGFIEQKVSSNKAIYRESEKVSVTLSKDRFEAFIKFAAPINGGAELTLDDIRKAIEQAGVVNGVDTELMKGLETERAYDVEYVIAKGTRPVDGINGSLEFFFDVDTNTLAPKWLDDGTVDFHSLNVLKMCYAGFRLVHAIPAIRGSDGTDVTGRVVAHRAGRPAPPLPRGKNVEINEDGDTLIAHINGQIVYEQGKVSISPVYEVKGDVDNSTGNIVFNGSVVVRGNILTGFSVRTAENIEVYGVLEGGELIAGASILLHSGVQGMGKAVIKARGDINAKYIENSFVEAGRDITAASVRHSSVKCGGDLLLTGKRALLVGGTTKVGGRITAGVIGSKMATATELEVGHEPKRLEEYKRQVEEYNGLKKTHEETVKNIVLLRSMDEKGELTGKYKAILLSALHTKVALEEKLKALNDEIELLRAGLDTVNGMVSAEKLIHCGVNILIGNAALYVRDDISSCSLVNDGEKIAVKSFVIAS